MTPPPVVPLFELLQGFQEVRPAEIATLRTILRTYVLPFWGIAPVTAADLDAALATISAARLYEIVDLNGAWMKDFAAALPAGSSYQKAYARFVRRLVAFGEKRGRLHPDQHLISPAWQLLVHDLELLLRDLPGPERLKLRGAFKHLARWATQATVEPDGVPLEGPGVPPMASYKASFAPERDGGYYQARRAWNLVASDRPEHHLRPWGTAATGRFATLPRAYWPDALQRGLEELFQRDGLGSWRTETRRGYAYRLGSYLGLIARCGIGAHDLLNPLTRGTDALRMLFQGIPAGFQAGTPSEFVGELVREPALREGLMAAMRDMSGSYEGRACEGNPFLLAAVTTLVDAGKIASARDLLIKALAINRGHLGITERHTTWLTRRLTLIDQLGRRNPAAYTLKKQAIFRAPTLWCDLVRARSRLRQDTLAKEEAWLAASGHPARELRRRWAVALRNEALFGLLLAYPLRASNVVDLQLDRHFRPQTYQIVIPAAETKNHREIDYELPDDGALGDLRQLFDRYLAEARPALLAGKRSAYVFVPDPRGGDRLARKAINAILDDLGRRFLLDVLPEGVKNLNPHLLRHAAATYHVAVGRNLNLAAQMLNDAPSTITRNYADVLASKKETTKRFLSSFHL